MISILFGLVAVPPLVLREVARKFRLIGEAYVHGIMNGEAVRDYLAGPQEAEMFCPTVHGRLVPSSGRSKYVSE